MHARKIALEPHNSVCSRLCQKPKLNVAGPPLYRRLGYSQVWEKVIGVTLIPELHNSAHPSFCSDFNSVASPRVESVESLEA